jgi:transposase-like protein
MTKTARARYTLEFKQEAVRLVERPEYRGGGARIGCGGADLVQLGQGAAPRHAHRS